MQVNILRAAAALLLAAVLLRPASAAMQTALSPEDEARIEHILAGMTVRQKVAQLLMVTLHGPVLTEVGAAFLREWQPGGVSLFGENITNPVGVTRLTNGYQRTITEAGGVPLLIAIDQEGGVVARLSERAGFTVWPAPVLITAAGGVMAYRVGGAVAEELSAVGINMNLAPVADLETNRENPIIFRRSFGNDPRVAGEAVAHYARGLQAGGVLATVKHFPGHGETREDSHGTLPRLDLDRARLEAVELPPFRQAINTGAAAVMVAHIWYPALDPHRRLPASLSPNVVGGLLRRELGFDGLVLTDALDMNAVDLEFPFGEAAVMAVEAGVDMIALGPSSGPASIQAALDALLAAVESGRISMARLDESVRRILRVKARFGLLDWMPLEEETAAQRVNAEAHAALVEELFRAGVTVAYDRANLVPVPAERSVSMIFLGTRYQIQHECGQYRPDIRWVAVSDAPSDEEIGWAAQAARETDIAVVWTQDAIRTPQQRALVNALPPEKTVAVALWSPYDWQTYSNVAAYMLTYSPARPAVPAACAVLFGALPARGQLAVTLSDVLVAGSGDR